MEWVEGIDLAGLIKAGRELGRPVMWPLVAAVGIGTLRGLGAAHDRIAPDGTPAPVIHRDVSPHNVLLGVNGVVKLSDFGLARARDRAASLTAPGTVKGKLSYLAPEVTFGKPNSVQSDLFGVANILWEALSGERLFDGKTDIEIFKKIRACQVPSIMQRRLDVPQQLANVLDIALAADPNNRYATAEEFAFSLSQVMKHAVGINPNTALAAAVVEARRTLNGDSDAVATSDHAMPSAGSLEVEFSRAEVGVEPVELTVRKSGNQPAMSDVVTTPELKPPKR
jgi:serine/threonine-protein kinase